MFYKNWQICNIKHFYPIFVSICYVPNCNKNNLKELWTIHTTKYVIFVQKQKQGDSVFITIQVTNLFLICVYCIRVVINWSLPVMSLLILSIIEFIRKIYDYSYEENKTDWNLINFDDPSFHKKLKGYHILTDSRGI